MKTEPIPAEFIPFASLSVPYWWGMDTLEQHWQRTEPYATHDPGSDTFQEYMFWRRISVMWVCATIEAFINEEGFVWLGGKFYKENLERLSVMKKLHTLYALKYQRRLSTGNAGIHHIQKLFKLRNEIVHPNAKKVEDSDSSDEGSRCELRTMAFGHLRRVFWTVTAFFEPDGMGQPDDDIHEPRSGQPSGGQVGQGKE